MKIRLDLQRHCIATEVKKLYNKSVSAFIKQAGTLAADEETRLENSVELLKRALEQLNFSWLRTEYPELAGKSTAEVTLGTGTEGELCIIIDRQQIEIRPERP